MHYDTEWCPKDATVTLRTEMDVLLIASNTPNPLDPTETYPSVPIELDVFEAPPADLIDPCVQHRQENYRAFENTWDYIHLMGLK